MASQPIPVSEAEQIASYILQPVGRPEVELPQAIHRINLVNLWGAIAPGSRVLELGCGQGNATAVLAHAVGPDGHVDAVDPGALDYGAPFTLAEAQAFISASAVGPRVSWHQATPEEHLAATGAETWDVAVLAHCIWYFTDPSVLGSILAALRGRVRRVCIAEYALAATHPAAAPHVLAVLARSTLEAHRGAGESSQNVRTPYGPPAIRRIAAEAGWELARRDAAEGGAAVEGVLMPEEGLLDGTWEIGTVKSESFLKEIEKSVPGDERIRVVLQTARDAVIAAVEACKGQKLRTMDVWAATFEEKK
ncbi:SAM-dependent methyltransferase [Xylariales sp. PMI_506]|nr:SAM-dependent methyltransferase [Xylariales sp. PMI_506]